MKRSTHNLGAALLLGIAVLAPQIGHGAGGLQLRTMPRQERVQISGVPILPMWDTTWWVAVEAEGAAICRLHYSARFVDQGDVRPQVGSIAVTSSSDGVLRGRVLVRCPRSVDYEKDLTVRLQAEGCDGSTSEWSESTFSLARLLEPPSATPTLTGEVQDLGPLVIETVTTEVDPNTSMEDVKAALDGKARALGASEATKIRLVETVGKRVRFAADAARVVKSTAAPKPTASGIRPDKILGEIEMRWPRQ